MNYKYEIVITIWEGNEFKLRDIIRHEDIDELKAQFNVVLENIELKLAQLKAKKYAIGEDDDIPF